MKNIHLVALLFTAFIFSGCLTSPMFSHATASPEGEAKALSNSKDCSLFFQSQNLCASVEWTKQPSVDEKGEFTLKFWKKDLATEAGPFVTPDKASVAVKLWMPSMGHGSSPVKVEETKDASNTTVPGVFKASDIYFIMNGSWEVWIQFKQDKTVIDQAKFSLIL